MLLSTPTNNTLIGLRKLGPKEKKVLDNRINKINKRLMKVAQTGGYASEAFTTLTMLMNIFNARVMQQQADDMGYTKKYGRTVHNGFASAIERVTLPDGTVATKIRRASWVLKMITDKELEQMERVLTPLEEREAVAKSLMDKNEVVTDASIRKAMEKQEAKNDFLNVVWSFLYNIKDVEPEVMRFLADLTGQTYQETSNSEAVRLYNKYWDKYSGESALRPLSDNEVLQNDNYKLQAQVAYYTASTDDEKKEAIREYLEKTTIRGGTYGDNGVKYGRVTDSDVETLFNDLKNGGKF